jgi:hypothetical protein
MADSDCDYCSEVNNCTHAWTETDCPVTQIEEAKQIVNSEFIKFYHILKDINIDICNDELNSVINHMYNLIQLSEESE